MQISLVSNHFYHLDLNSRLGKTFSNKLTWVKTTDEGLCNKHREVRRTEDKITGSTYTSDSGTCVCVLLTVPTHGIHHPLYPALEVLFV
jgi:hypothetical protein